MAGGTKEADPPLAGSGSGEDGTTAAANANSSNDIDNTSVLSSGDNTLWEQMTAREGREAGRRAGMRAGDWQAERQLQEALRESRQEADDATSGGASAPSGTGNSGEDRSFINAGFHALATDAVEDEEGNSAAYPAGQRLTSGNPEGTNGNGQDLSAVMHSIDNAAAAAAAEAASSGRATHQMSRGGGRGGAGAAGDNANNTRGIVGSSVGGQGAGEEEDEEDFGNVELVVTQDGGIIPVAAAATAAAAAAVGDGSAAVVVPGSETSQTRGRGARKDRGRVGGDDNSGDISTGGPVRSTVTQGGGVDEEGEGEEVDKEEEEAPLPPDIVLTLADDVLHRVMLFLHPEEIFECRAVSSRWDFPGHEAVFEGLCRRTYLAQSAKKLLNVKRWRSWQRMFKFRPRLRDTGLYSLKTTYFKKPVRDMSTDWTPGKILKVTYYRYFRFFGDGRVAYALTHDTPREFVRMMQEGSPKVVYGTYTISKWEVNVEIPNPWSWVNFTLQLANGERGRFTHLVMLRHSSVPRNDARAGRCHHSVKSTDFFTFRRVWQF